MRHLQEVSPVCPQQCMVLSHHGRASRPSESRNEVAPLIAGSGVFALQVSKKCLNPGGVHMHVDNMNIAMKSDAVNDLSKTITTKSALEFPIKMKTQNTYSICSAFDTILLVLVEEIILKCMYLLAT